MDRNIERAVEIMKDQQHREEVKDLLNPVGITPRKEKEAKDLARSISITRHLTAACWDSEDVYL